jgi:hypothetical protein
MVRRERQSYPKEREKNTCIQEKRQKNWQVDGRVPKHRRTVNMQYRSGQLVHWRQKETRKYFDRGMVGPYLITK